MIRTRYEIETFVLGAHPSPARKAQVLTQELMKARETSHPDLPVLEAIYKDFSAEHNVEELTKDIESTEEEYWVHRLAKLAAIDILTIGKVQPEHMAYMVALPDEAFKASVKEATSITEPTWKPHLTVSDVKYFTISYFWWLAVSVNDR